MTPTRNTLPETGDVMVLRPLLVAVVLLCSTVNAQTTKQPLTEMLNQLRMQEGYRFERGKHCTNYLLSDGSVYGICQDMSDVPTANPKALCSKIDRKLVCDFNEQDFNEQEENF